MAKTANTATMADINDPAPDQTENRGASGSDRHAASPAPEAVKAQQRADDDGMAGLARKATAEQAAAAQDAAAAGAEEQADRLRDASDSFDAGSFAHAATERVADNLSEAARSIRDTDLTHLTDDLATFARRQPLLFFGGAALLGFAAGRMLKASERAGQTDDGTAHDRRVS
jgi:hypothetical protein